MKTIVNHEYGSPDILKLEEVEKPAPKDDEDLIKVHAAAVNIGDYFFLTGKPFTVRLDPGGFENRRPRYLAGT